LEEQAAFRDTIEKVEADIEREALEEGYSSREIEGPDAKRSLRK